MTPLEFLRRLRRGRRRRVSAPADLEGQRPTWPVVDEIHQFETLKNRSARTWWFPDNSTPGRHHIIGADGDEIVTVLVDGTLLTVSVPSAKVHETAAAIEALLGGYATGGILRPGDTSAFVGDHGCTYSVAEASLDAMRQPSDAELAVRLAFSAPTMEELIRAYEAPWVAMIERRRAQYAPAFEQIARHLAEMVEKARPDTDGPSEPDEEASG